MGSPLFRLIFVLAPGRPESAVQIFVATFVIIIQCNNVCVYFNLHGKIAELASSAFFPAKNDDPPRGNVRPKDTNDLLSKMLFCNSHRGKQMQLSELLNSRFRKMCEMSENF